MKDKGRLMALDVGDARVGIALSDPLRISCQPLTTIERGTARETLDKLLSLIEQHQVVGLVVGLPFGLDGQETEQTRKTSLFTDTLREEVNSRGIEVVSWDERLTTVEAEEIIAGSKLKNRKRREVLDRVSASLILQTYLESLR